MDRADAWLSSMIDSCGENVPPPSPNIPSDYLAKPRRKCLLLREHYPLLYKSSLPEPTTKRKRTVLDQIHQLNPQLLLDEPLRAIRKQQHRTCKTAMPPRSRSPAKRRNPLREGDMTENIVDLEATPRQPRLRNAAVPTLMPSTSEGNTGDDDGVSSIADSADSRVSGVKRSVSPTKRMVDLRVADKKVVQKSIGSVSDVPEDVRDLWKKLRYLEKAEEGIVPRKIQARIERACDEMEFFLPSHVAKERDQRTEDQLFYELMVIQDIRDDTFSCRDENLHEHAWNESVHSRILKEAVRPLSGLRYYNITNARVIKGLLPGNKYGEALRHKMVDYAITLQDPLIEEDHITRRLTCAADALVRTINPSDYSPLCHKPIAISIETKTPNGSREAALVQLSIWVTAHFNRLRTAGPDLVTITLPLLFVSGEHWRLLFARDLDNSIEILEGVDIGKTDSILGCYRLLKSLRLICSWVEEKYQPWFTDNVLAPE